MPDALILILCIVLRLWEASNTSMH